MKLKTLSILAMGLICSLQVSAGPAKDQAIGSWICETSDEVSKSESVSLSAEFQYDGEKITNMNVEGDASRSNYEAEFNYIMKGVYTICFDHDSGYYPEDMFTWSRWFMCSKNGKHGTYNRESDRYSNGVTFMEFQIVNGQAQLKVEYNYVAGESTFLDCRRK